MTFSIAGRCAETGMLGVAVSSSSPAVAARCAHARAGVGAALSQNVTDPRLGTRALDLLERGATARQAIDLLAAGPAMDFRQVLVVDGAGHSAIHSGTRVLGLWAEAHGDNVACAGNLLARPELPVRMKEAFETTKGHLAGRLLAAMHAAIEAGGEEGPVHSAGMLVVDRVAWPIVDLRIDWSDACPITELSALWDRYRPQMQDYITRALNPEAAPSYGVPGDA